MRENWIRKNLFQIASNSPKSFVDGDWIESPYITDQGIRLIQTGNIGIGKFKNKSKKYISESSFQLLNCTEVYPGDLLICRLAEPAGRACIVPDLGERYITSVDVSILRLNNTCSKDFIHHLLNNQAFLSKVELLSGGSTRQRISRSNLGNIDLFLPPLPQQQKIAKILSTCDEVIEKTETAIAKYQALKQGMMQDLFTRGIDIKTGKLRPSYSESPELYKDSDLGMIPKDWEVDELLNLTTLVTDGSHFSPIPQEKGFPIGNVKDMLDSTFNYEGCTKILPEVFELLKRQNCSPKKGDVLLSKDGTVGKVIHFQDDQQLVLLSSIAIIRVNELIDSSYLAWTLRSDIFDRALYRLLSGSALKRITLKDIQKIQIPYSKNIEEQKIIASKLLAIENKIQSEQSSLSKYMNLKSGLMQDLLTGKVEVKVESNLENAVS